jgi:hypothetical protein
MRTPACANRVRRLVAVVPTAVMLGPMAPEQMLPGLTAALMSPPDSGVAPSAGVPVVVLKLAPLTM